MIKIECIVSSIPPGSRMKFCYPSAKQTSDVIIIIIMYIYHALMDALSVHMIQIINLNPIFDTHVEHALY